MGHFIQFLVVSPSKSHLAFLSRLVWITCTGENTLRDSLMNLKDVKNSHLWIFK